MIVHQKINIIGYSGHAYVCIETATAMGHSVVGYYDNREKDVNPYGLRFLGEESAILDSEVLFISIGDNGTRKSVVTKLEEKNKDLTFINLIHPNGSLSPSSVLGKGILISPGAMVNALVTIGDFSIINTGAIIEHECTIGDFVHIAPGVVLAGNVTIGKSTFVGANSVIKQGITICENVTIGMGAVVTKDITEPGVYVGTPAVRVK